MKIRSLSAGWLALPIIFAACTEPVGPTAPEIRPPEAPGATAIATCHVDVASRTVRCEDVRAPGSGIRAAILVGGQEMFVRISTTGTSYDTGTQIFRTDLAVQNLLKQTIGTTDGFTVDGVKVFLHGGPTVTSGTGIVTMNNADGTSTFTNPDQPFYNYPQILTSYEISAQREWRFNVPASATTFSFTLLISTTVADETAAFLDRLWTGSAGTAWGEGSNWNGGIPGDSSTVAVPVPSLISSGNQPVLSAPVTVKNLRIGAGSTLSLAANELTVTGNLDSPGTITGGPTLITGSGVLLGGNVAALSIDGSTRLQRAMRATGPVEITGSLSAADKPLTISIQ